MDIILVRHGSTAPNERGVLLGQGNDPGLTDAGREQATAVAHALAGVTPLMIWSSPLRRCLETAGAIAAAHDALPPTAVEPRLAEIDYGEWEGVPLADLPAEAMRTWRRDPAFRPPGGESLAEVTARVGEWCDEQTGDGTIIAVTHVSPIKAAVIWALDGSPTMAWRLHVGVASITTVAARDGAPPAVLGFNERAHLRSNGSPSTPPTH
ncbi:MAG TPA: histidine phosphatase family protein [Acidimicrobiia bacterium]|nr:histidine phosphatase family protein [Acidimicrobiia bacterium]